MPNYNSVREQVRLYRLKVQPHSVHVDSHSVLASPCIPLVRYILEYEISVDVYVVDTLRVTECMSECP